MVKLKNLGKSGKFGKSRNFGKYRKTGKSREIRNFRKNAKIPKNRLSLQCTKVLVLGQGMYLPTHIYEKLHF